jgi:hypothetical protein
MANSYTQFCVFMPKNKDISDSAKTLMAEFSNYYEGEEHSLSPSMLEEIEYNGAEEELGFSVDWEGADGQDVVIYSDENGSVELAAAVISNILSGANSDDVVILNYAMTSKTEFGGGSAAISRKEIEYFDPTTLAMDAADVMRDNLASSPAP